MKFFNPVLAATTAALLLPYSTFATLAEEKLDVELVSQGAQLYAQHCSHCHGFNMVNPGTVAFDLRTFPHNDKNRFVDSVANGKNNRMPPWGDLLKQDEIDRLWAYVSSYKQP